MQKNGFKNEEFVVETFNNWHKSKLAKQWLIAMGYNIDDIENVKAQKIKGGYKADVQVVINIQVKLVSNPHGFNQIDKRQLQSYVKLWKIPNVVLEILKYFTGEKSPKIANSRDNRRMFFDEFLPNEQTLILEWFDKNKIMIINDVLKGRGRFASEWFLVILKVKNYPLKWVLKPINEVVNF